MHLLRRGGACDGGSLASPTAASRLLDISAMWKRLSSAWSDLQRRLLPSAAAVTLVWMVSAVLDAIGSVATPEGIFRQSHLGVAPALSL